MVLARTALALSLAACTTAYQLDPGELADARERRSERPLMAMDGERRAWLAPESVVDEPVSDDNVVELYDERHAIRGWGYGLTTVGSLGLLTQITFAATGSEFTSEAWPWAAAGSAVAVGAGLLVWALFSDGPEVAEPPPLMDTPSPRDAPTLTPVDDETR